MTFNRICAIIYNMLDYLSNIRFLFYNFNEIKVDLVEYNNYNLAMNDHLLNPVKYFIWRKVALASIFPFIITDIVLNMLSYYQIKTHINFVNTSNIFGNLQYTLNDYTETFSLIQTYYIATTIFICVKLILLLIGLYNKNNWTNSQPYIFGMLAMNTLLIYLIFSNPLMNYLKILNKNINTTNNTDISYTKHPMFHINNNESYSFMYLFLNFLKELLPLTIPLFLGLIWASRNLKTLFPNDLIIGHLYKYGVYLFIITSGTILLILNQIFYNYLISISIIFFNIALIIGLYMYGKIFQIYHDDSVDNINELIQYNFNVEFIKNVALMLICICNLIYALEFNLNIVNGIYQFHSLDMWQLAIRYIYNILFYRVIFCDLLFEFMINHEKYKKLLTNEIKDYSDKMNTINDSLYMHSVNLNNNYYNTF